MATPRIWHARLCGGQGAFPSTYGAKSVGQPVRHLERRNANFVGSPREFGTRREEENLGIWRGFSLTASAARENRKC
jgi:hypothetical protein